MTSSPIQSAYRRVWWSLVIRGIFGVALGVLILWRPLESIAAFALVIAFYALFTGIVEVVHALELRSLIDHWWLTLLSGVIGIVFGIAALYYYPVLSLAYAVICTALWLCLTGGVAAYLAFVERRLQMPWGWTLAFGILSIVVGVLCLASPPTTLAAIMGLIAGFAIIAGIALLVGAYRLSDSKRNLTSRVGAATA